MSKAIEEFLAYSNKIGNRITLYETVSKKYGIKRALYPGSHIDISPSMVIPEVIYIDNFKGSIKFFKNIDEINDYVNKNKKYMENTSVTFYGNDYNEHLDIESVDLIISQYAGFVGQATKYLLKDNGILLANDSHGDATLAYFDEDFELIGIVNGKNEIKTDNLDKYFKLSNSKIVDLEKVLSKMSGPKYKYNAPNYIFKYSKKS
ncbi:MAG: hypothetical protein CVV60_04440 [Tenericutes bacterium HGW-Tenericutes-5]|jgi:hypothetical protein|nr:MAG: hypothetical protein CVV60_04440 [Tenericutes bacterium HGW-Tenericutes-5]